MNNITQNNKIWYKGFSSYNYEYNKSFTLINRKLVDRDLLNYIFTPLNTRIMMPFWGTRIPLILFEPMTQDVIDIVQTDLTTVFESDPRVAILNNSLTVTPNFNNHTIFATVLLQYIELNFNDTFDINLQFNQ